MDNERHAAFMKQAISEARKSPPKPTNFCVGAVLVDEKTGEILSTGHTLELPGNTHAEQCALSKFATKSAVSEEQLHEVLPVTAVLYTTMEPCNERLSGNLPCADRIIQTRKHDRRGICKVYSGVKEPDTFIGQNTGRLKLEKAGIECIYVPGFEDEILAVAKAGHSKPA